MSGEELDANHPCRESSQQEQNLGIKSPKLLPSKHRQKPLGDFNPVCSIYMYKIDVSWEVTTSEVVINGAFKSCWKHCTYEHERHHKVIITRGKLWIFFEASLLLFRIFLLEN